MADQLSGRVHVVIVNYRSVEHLTRCLQALEREAFATITVLENGSGTRELLQVRAVVSASRLAVSLIESPQNLGFGGGVNRAVETIEASTGEFIWILNPDTVPDAGAGKELVRAMIEHGSQLGSPYITTGIRESPRIWFAGGELDLMRGVARHSRQGELASAELREASGSDFLTGAALMVEVSAWQRLGGFREDLFLYWEDVDLSLRAERMGMHLLVILTARVWHRVGGSGAFSGRSKHYYFYMARNRLAVCAESVGLISLMTLGGLETVRLLARPLREHGFGKMKVWAALRGTLAGLTWVLRSRVRLSR